MNRTEYIGKLNALYVGDKNCLEELITAYDEKDKEIERLKDLCDKYEEEHKTTFEEWKKAINIIKEVREYCNNDNNFEIMTDFDTFENHNIIGKDILEILDKVGSEKE